MNINLKYIGYSALETICEPFVCGAGATIHLMDFAMTKDRNALANAKSAAYGVFYLTAYKALITAIAILDIKGAMMLESHLERQPPLLSHVPKRNLYPCCEKVRFYALLLFSFLKSPQHSFRKNKQDLFDL